MVNVCAELYNIAQRGLAASLILIDAEPGDREAFVICSIARRIGIAESILVNQQVFRNPSGCLPKSYQQKQDDAYGR